MKKFIITALLFLTFIPFVSAKTTVSVTKTEGNKGDTVTVYLNLANNPNFEILGVTLKYDSKVLNYEKGEITALKKSFIKELDEKEGKVSLAVVSISPLKDTGNIAKFEFKIKTNEVASSTIEVEVTDFGADENTPLEFSTNNGVITIKDGKKEEPAAAPAPETPKKEEDKKPTTNNAEKEPTKEENNSEEPKETNNNTYVSSDEEIATVDEQGNITYKKEGKVTISTIDKDGNISDKEIEVTKEMLGETKKRSKLIYIIAGIVGIVALVSAIVVGIKNKNEKK